MVPRMAHERGMKAYLYVSLFDEGWPLPSRQVRENSYHNAMHGRHWSWQSRFSREFPDYHVVDRSGRRHQWGVLSLSYPQVRSFFIKRYTGLLKGRGFDGLFVCLRSQSRPADYADQLGFNEPAVQDYMGRYGKNVRKEAFNIQVWRNLLGEYLTVFLAELKQKLRAIDVCLAVGAARGDILGPPLGNVKLDWRKWVKNDLVDDLIINQNSSVCPSMWHELWPMHRGSGYVQNYLDGSGLPALVGQLAESYQPLFRKRKTNLYVARQWEKRSDSEEKKLQDIPCVMGLVFSSFRHDNPGPIARGDWRL